MKLRIIDEEFAIRADRVRSFLRDNDIDAFLLTGDEHRQGDVRYFTDFRPMLEYSAVIIPKDDEAILLAGPESYDLAVMESRVSNIMICEELKIPGEEYPNTKLHSVRNILSGLGNVKTVAKANLEYSPYFLVEAIQNALEDCRFVDASDLIADMRGTKSEMEIAIQKHAYRVTDLAIERGKEVAKPGAKESDIAAEMAKVCYQQGGASQLSHCFLIAAGKKSSAALSFVSDKSIAREGDTLILDIGFLYEGYYSDASKTIIVGTTDNQEKIDALDTAKQALRAALKTVKAGVPGREVDRAARSVIESAGFGEHCLYGVMHGVGLQHCEHPVCGPSTEMLLRPNMVFSIDVGLFNFEWGGIREEVGIVVTEEGCELLHAREG